MEKKKNKSVNNVLIILIIVLSICLVVSVSYIGYDKFSNDYVVENESDSKDEVDDTEKENDSIALNKMMTGYVKMLERINVIGNYSTSSTFGQGVIYAADFESSDIPYDEKLYVVLEQLYLDNMDNSPVTTDYKFDNDYLKESSTQIDVSEVEKLYTSLYGSSDFEHKSLSGKCPDFIYDSLNAKYYGLSGCGGVSPLSIETYVYSVTTKGNNVYAYVSFGARDMANITPVIYTDFAMTKVYNGTVLDTLDIVNENNYNDFSQYRYVFTKNDGGYSFSKIEKIK